MGLVIPAREYQNSLPDCWGYAFPGAPKVEADDDELLRLLLKSAKLEFADDVETASNLFSLNVPVCCVENMLSEAFMPPAIVVPAGGGQTKFEVDCTGLLPVLGHGLVFN